MKLHYMPITITDPDAGKEPTPESISAKYLRSPVSSETYHALRAEFKKIRYAQLSKGDRNWGRPAAKHLLIMMKFVKFYIQRKGEIYESTRSVKIFREKGTRFTECISCEIPYTEAEKERGYRSYLVRNVNKARRRY